MQYIYMYESQPTKHVPLKQGLSTFAVETNKKGSSLFKGKRRDVKWFNGSTKKYTAQWY